MWNMRLSQGVIKRLGQPKPPFVRLVETSSPSRSSSTAILSSSSLYRHRPRLQQLVQIYNPTQQSTPTMSRSLHGPQPQAAVTAPLTKSATFLIVTVKNTPQAIKTVRSTLSSISDLSKNVSLRDLGSLFACTVGIGSSIWDSLTGLPRPAELRPFPIIKGKVHSTVSTPGDVLFHIRSDRRDICFEFERQLMNLLGDAVTVVDDTQGFRYFDARELLGFVDGTANPSDPAAVSSSVLVTREDEDAAAAAASVGGSYMVVQKYMHDMKRWGSLSTKAQESIIGRTKLDNIELEDPEPGHQQPHKSLATIQDEDSGTEHEILRDNMPFGSPGSGVFGTYFIGYSRRLWVIEQMLQRMFVGDPPGMHDVLLDYSTPLSGTTFFAPSADVLASLDS